MGGIEHRQPVEQDQVLIGRSPPDVVGTGEIRGGHDTGERRGRAKGIGLDQARKRAEPGSLDGPYREAGLAYERCPGDRPRSVGRDARHFQCLNDQLDRHGRDLVLLHDELHRTLGEAQSAHCGDCRADREPVEPEIAESVAGRRSEDFPSR